MALLRMRVKYKLNEMAFAFFLLCSFSYVLSLLVSLVYNLSACSAENIRACLERWLRPARPSNQAKASQSLVAMDHPFLFGAGAQLSLGVLRYCLGSAWKPGWQPKIAPKLPNLRRAEPGSPATVIFRVRLKPGRGGGFGPNRPGRGRARWSQMRECAPSRAHGPPYQTRPNRLRLN